MSKSEPPIQKKHASGSWRAVRSTSVPAGVNSVHSSEFAPSHHSGIRRMQKIEGAATPPRERQAPGYFETADPSFSKS